MARQDDPSQFFPKPFLKRLDEEHVVRARLLHAESVLDSGRVSEWLKDLDVEEGVTIRTLRDRQSELMESVARFDEAGEKRRSAVKGYTGPTVSISRRPLADLGNIDVRYPFGCPPSEGSVPVPLPLEGPSVVPPAGHNASGQILTIPTITDPWEAMEPHYRAELSKRPSFPYRVEQSYWLKNWRWIIPFPCAPCDSRLTYRMYVETGGAFGANGISVGLWNWINVRELSSVTGGINFGTVPDYEVWPISRLWPGSASFTYESIWGGVTLEGALGVKDGQAPVVAILMGAIVGVGFGSFRVINAGFHPWEMQLFPPGGYPQQWHYQFHARVHYRYTPAGPVISP